MKTVKTLITVFFQDLAKWKKRKPSTEDAQCIISAQNKLLSMLSHYAFALSKIAEQGTVGEN